MDSSGVQRLPNGFQTSVPNGFQRLPNEFPVPPFRAILIPAPIRSLTNVYLFFRSVPSSTRRMCMEAVGSCVNAVLEVGWTSLEVVGIRWNLFGIRFWKSLESVGSHWKSLEFFGMSEPSGMRV